MLRDKKGLSTVITTIIIVAIGLVAVAIVFAVVQNLLSKSGTDIDFMTKCQDAGFAITDVTCHSTNPDKCDVTVKRTSGSQPVDGIRVVVSDGSVSSTPKDSAGDLQVGATRTVTSITMPSGSSDVVQAEVYPYFTEGSVTKVCPQPVTTRNVHY